MTKTLYLAWQDPKTRRWCPVGRLTWKSGVYRFVYTKGAEISSNFIPFGRMRDLHAVYESQQLFPLFSNRLLSSSRPEYKQFLYWLNVREGEDDPLALLARTGGIRQTDTLMVFPCPEPGPDNTYSTKFFSHGIRYLPEHSIFMIDKLQSGERLYLMPDPQNPHDAFAIALRTSDPPTIVGYCPAYLTHDLQRLLQEKESDGVKVLVDRVNADAPIQLRLLCNAIGPWPSNFRPCSGEEYTPLAD